MFISDSIAVKAEELAKRALGEVDGGMEEYKGGLIGVLLPVVWCRCGTGLLQVRSVLHH